MKIVKQLEMNKINFLSFLEQILPYLIRLINYPNPLSIKRLVCELAISSALQFSRPVDATNRPSFPSSDSTSSFREGNRNFPSPSRLRLVECPHRFLQLLPIYLTMKIVDKDMLQYGSLQKQP